MARYWLSMQPIAWFSRVRALHSVSIFLRSLGLGLLLFLVADAAVAATDIHQVLKNLRNVIYPLTAMVLVCSYVLGIYFIFRAIAMMKKFGTMMTQQSQPGEFGGPMVHLVVGTVLLFLPASTDVTMVSLFGNTASIFGYGSVDYSKMGTGSNLLNYSGGSGSLEQQWGDLANTLVIYIQFLGFLSFVKGWILVSKAGAPGVQPGSITKGMTHIIGGVGLINIVGLVKIFRNTIFAS